MRAWEEVTLGTPGIERGLGLKRSETCIVFGIGYVRKNTNSFGFLLSN